MRRLLGLVALLGGLAFVGCQQTQEADDEPDTTVIEETEPADADADMEMDVRMDEGGATGEMQMEGEAQTEGN